MLTYVVVAGLLWMLTRRRREADRPVRPREPAQEERSPAGPPVFEIRDGASILRQPGPRDPRGAGAAGNYVEFALEDGRRPLMRASHGPDRDGPGAARLHAGNRSWLVNAERVRALSAAGSGDFRLDLGCGLTAPCPPGAIPRRSPGLGKGRGPSWRFGVIGLGQRIAQVLAAMKEVGWDLRRRRLRRSRRRSALPILAGRGHPARAARSETPEALLAAGPYDLVMIGSAQPPAPGAPDRRVRRRLSGVRREADRAHRGREPRAGRGARGEGAPPLFIGLVMRSMPIVKEVIARVDSGELGRADLDGRHRAPAARARRLSGPQLAAPAASGAARSCSTRSATTSISSAASPARGRRRVASFGGRRIFTPSAPTRRTTYEDGSPAYALRDAGWRGANDAFQSDMDLADHQIAHRRVRERLSRCRSTPTATSPCRSGAGTSPGAEGTLIADLVRNRLMVRRALHRAQAGADRLSAASPPTPTTAPTRRSRTG